MLKPIGNRLLVRPLHQDAEARQIIAAMRSTQNSELIQKLASEMSGERGPIQLVTTVPPVAGKVLSVGRPFCTSCKEPVESQIQPGDVVVYPRTAGMEVGVDGVTHLVMRPDDVLLIWRPDERTL